MHLKLKHLVMIAAMLAFISCKSTQDLAYLEDLQQSGTLAKSPTQIKLEPFDELAITVSSEIPKATAHFNLPMGGTLDNIEIEAASSQKLQTYIVNTSGDIDFPGIGTIHVEGMTTTQLKDYLVNEISKTVKSPIVSVRLINFKINVLGEVAKPGVVEAKAERMTIFDALAKAGDMTVYGKRENVMVIREMPDGTIAYQKLNLRDSDITQSPFFNLKQNDIIYVAPNSVRQDNSKYNQNNGFKLSVISTVASAVSVISSLIIALTR